MQIRHQELAKRRADDPVAKQKVELLGERNRAEETVKAQQQQVEAHKEAIASEERREVALGAQSEQLKTREAVEVPRARCARPPGRPTGPRTAARAARRAARPRPAARRAAGT